MMKSLSWQEGKRECIVGPVAPVSTSSTLARHVGMGNGKWGNTMLPGTFHYAAALLAVCPVRLRGCRCCCCCSCKTATFRLFRFLRGAGAAGRGPPGGGGGGGGKRRQ